MKRYRISRDELTVRSEQVAARAAREQATEFVNGGSCALNVAIALIELIVESKKP